MIESVEAMKKIFEMLVIFATVFYGTAALACSQEMSGSKTEGMITGGACSISELNNLEKNKSVQKMSPFPIGERDLRPVKLSSPKPNDVECLLGLCLYQKVLEGK